MRTARPTPRDLAEGWPDVPSADPVGETARQFAIKLAAGIGGRAEYAVAKSAGVHHSTIRRILDGQIWPDMWTIAKLENGLGVELWPRK